MKHFLSPRELSHALGVSESSVKRWADDGLIATSRTAGGHRRIALADALHFVRKQGIEVAQGDLLGLPSLRGNHHHTEHAVSVCLLEGDRAGLERILLDHYACGGALADICDGPIRQAFVDIGSMWEHRDDGILIEHRAVDTCLQALSTLRNLLPAPADDAPCALGGAPADDPYILPSLMAALVIAERGWKTVNLGPNTPWPTFQTAARQLNPTLIWITVSAPPSVQALEAASHWVQHLQDLGVSVALGGRNAAALGTNLPCHHPATMADLVAIADSVIPCPVNGET